MHMRMSHGQIWRCLFGCNQTMSTRAMFENHLSTEHHGHFTTKELPTLVDLCKKHTLDIGTSYCPCCGETLETSDKFYRHLANHMEHLALLSLMPDLPCKFSPNASVVQTPQSTATPVLEPDFQTSPPRLMRDRDRGRTNIYHAISVPRRSQSVSYYEQGYGLGVSHEKRPRDRRDHDHSFERRRSWSGPRSTNQKLVISPNSQEHGETGQSLDVDIIASNATSWRILPSTTGASTLDSFLLVENADTIAKREERLPEVGEDDLRAIFSSETGFQDIIVSTENSLLASIVEFESISSAFKAAYKLNRRPMPNSMDTRLSIDLLGNTLSVHVTRGLPPDAPLLPTADPYPYKASITSSSAFKQYQDYEQTDQSWWSPELSIHSSGPRSFAYD